ncbi:hypothetical protein [Aquimarina algiphila]|uniref:hypothetical protein n=1 Tax=Aquimarina algiphila TaxID=2047982 RepID=UPI00232B8A4A|nr:hypothetical protein [Aquimarina algiphila]
MKFKKYYATEEFARLANKDKRTIKRLKKKLITKNPNTNLVIAGRPDKYHHSLLKKFLSPSIYNIIMNNKSLLNTIRCLSKTDTLEYKLFKMPWKWWCTVSYANELHSNACRDTMNKLYDYIESKYGNKSELRMFYTTESFSCRDEGHHNHFVLDVSEEKYHYSIKKDIEKFLEGNRIYIEKYDELKPCIFYCGKEGLYGTDWDILGNNLKQNGVDYD